MTYAGFHHDSHGLTQLGRVVLDAWVFGLLPREQDCQGWDLGRMQGLMQQVQQHWDLHGGLPSRLPPDLLARHTEYYEWALARARERDWNPEEEVDD
jgi:hypothetical protein